MYTLLILLCCIAQTLAFPTLKGKIYNYRYHDDNSTVLILTDVRALKTQYEYPFPNGDFEFTKTLPQSEYKLELNSDSIELLISYRIFTNATDYTIYEVPLNTNPNSSTRKAELPLLLNQYKRSSLLLKRPKFSLVKFLIQPTVILSIAALAFITYVPIFLRSLDPETLNQLKDNQIKTD